MYFFIVMCDLTLQVIHVEECSLSCGALNSNISHKFHLHTRTPLLQLSHFQLLQIIIMQAQSIMRAREAAVGKKKDLKY